MRNNWIFFTNLDLDGGCQYTSPTESQFLQGFGVHLLSQFGSLVDLSFNHSSHFVSSGSLAFQEAYSCISKFAGAFLLWYSSRPNILCKFSSKPRGSRNYQSSAPLKHVSSSRRSPAGMFFGYGDAGYAAEVFFANLARSTLWHLWKQVEQNKAFPIISLAAALVPPFDNLSSKVLAESIPLRNSGGHISEQLDRSFTEGDCRRCVGRSMPNLNWGRDATEPKTGIKFPTILDTSLAQDNPYLTTEVLVGIGSRSMRIIKIKTLKVYAFGLYVHPDSVCEKLGPKYASVPVSELKNRSEFYEDLLRENIHMSVRLVVNCNGVKINTVRDAFEKSLRNRLEKVLFKSSCFVQSVNILSIAPCAYGPTFTFSVCDKMNPSTDYNCLQAFGSYFKQDIPLPVGTTINFRQTADGELITEIGGKLIGAVHSKDLCRAFFDMYIGDVPVSVQAKEEIAQNVAGLIRRC